jgi:hypothetical protein
MRNGRFCRITSMKFPGSRPHRPRQRAEDNLLSPVCSPADHRPETPAACAAAL